MIIIPAYLKTIKTLVDNTISLVFETNELSSSKVGELFSFRGKYGFLAYNPNEFNVEERAMVIALKTDYEGEKSPSKRMKSVLFALWKQDAHGYEDFNLFYQYRMNELCEMLKNEFDR
jgi:hypothetical protein